MKIRVWAEYLTPVEAIKPDIVKLLKKYDVTLGMAFPPGSMNAGFAKMMKKYEEAGVEVALWVLLPDEQGYWACERNAAEFSDYVKKIFGWAEEKKFSIPWIAVDLEPPLYQLNEIRSKKTISGQIFATLKSWKENRDLGRFYESSYRLEALNEFIHSREAKTLCPIGNFVVEDVVAGGTAFQDMLETPVTTVNWDMLSVMIYTSMFVGYSKGLLKPRDARWYLYSILRDFKERLWDRAGVSIGVTYVGKLEDEPYYETPAQLLPDMQAAKAALIDDITIYNLEGILRSPRPEEWFETLIAAEAKQPERSVGVDMFRTLCGAVARLS